ncbi:zf-HC2 domain-containing protein [Zafaria sp. J156]|uniref:zf-HC2 domain-containing protein n=1 Tax=Zafaria sp. J156 TaxID=3116490 RepID=UPI002E7A461D|nr:zf-HC2 domain-containing protein [Zafaria sp. J156]MEE1620390.1 zf-HC2 domain-containing protein [Zafaria sp. J156]
MHRHERWIDSYVDGELAGRRLEDFEAHVRGCADCRVLVEDRRRLKRRLGLLAASGRAAPAPDPALMARLMAGPTESAPTGSAPAWPLEAAPRSGPRRIALPALASVAALALLAGVLGAAWLIGAPGAASTASAAGSLAWSWDGEEEVLDREEIGALRAAGWNCPHLGGTTWSLARASGSRSAGTPHITLEYAGPGGTLTVTERRKAVAPSGADALRFGAGVAAHAGSAVPGPADPFGFAVEDTTAPAAPTAAAQDPSEAPAGGGDSATATAWTVVDSGDGYVVYRRAPGETVVDMESAVYSVRTEAAEGARVGEVVDRIVVTEHSRVAAQAAAVSGMWERIGRGLARLVVLEPRQ